MPDLAPIRARLAQAKSVIAYYEKRGLQIMIFQEKRRYVEDVAALLAALDDRAQQEDGETCSDCPPAGYPTDKTRCDECPRMAQGEDDRG